MHLLWRPRIARHPTTFLLASQELLFLSCGAGAHRLGACARSSSPRNRAHGHHRSPSAQPGPARCEPGSRPARMSVEQLLAAVRASAGGHASHCPDFGYRDSEWRDRLPKRIDDLIPRAIDSPCWAAAPRHGFAHPTTACGNSINCARAAALNAARWTRSPRLHAPHCSPCSSGNRPGTANEDLPVSDPLRHRRLSDTGTRAWARMPATTCSARWWNAPPPAAQLRPVRPNRQRTSSY